MTAVENEKSAKRKANEIPCPACGKPIRLDARQCGHCGKTFTEQQVKDRIASAWKFQLGCLAVFAPIALIGYCAMQPNEAEVEAETQRLIAEREKGLHCLDGINGESSAVVLLSKARLRDPSSFEHVSTRIGPRTELGTHTLIMRYRARNGFGGMTIGTISAEINSYDCGVKKLELLE